MILKSEKYNVVIFTKHFIQRLKERRDPESVKEIILDIEGGKARPYIRNGKEYIEVYTHIRERIVLEPDEDSNGVFYRAITYVDTRGFGSVLHFEKPSKKYRVRKKPLRKQR